jgi:hypothetical protein
MKCMMLLVFAGLTLLFSSPAYAHHSGAAVYKLLETMTIEGELSQVAIRNPHSWIWVVVKDDKGQTQRWGLEWGGARQLTQQGVANAFKVGDKVVVTGSPGRNPRDLRMLLRTITRPSDGLSWGTREGEAVEGADR